MPEKIKTPAIIENAFNWPLSPEKAKDFIERYHSDQGEYANFIRRVIDGTEGLYKAMSNFSLLAKREKHGNDVKREQRSIGKNRRKKRTGSRK